jgi:citrate synthase
MSSAVREPAVQDVADWWQTGISRIAPDTIEIRGHPIADLIGKIGFTDMIWLLLRGELPGPGQAALLEACLVAGVDHGPQAPSVAISRMAITCGVGLNNAVASGVNTLGDVHGGAGEQSLELFLDVVATAQDVPLDEAAAVTVDRWRQRSRYLPGFGHRFHHRDPRRDPLLALAGRAVAAGEIRGDVVAAATAVERVLNSGGANPSSP